MLRESKKKRIAYSGIIGALAIGLGFALATIPNVELVTLSLVFGGFILGPIWGGLTGAIAWLIYSIINPMGAPPPHFLLVQGLSGFVAGLAGSLLAIIFRNNKSTLQKAIYAGFCGFSVTLFYQLGINIAAFVVYGSEETLIPFVISGLVFSSIHLMSNTLIFVLVFPIITGIFRKSK